MPSTSLIPDLFIFQVDWNAFKVCSLGVIPIFKAGCVFMIFHIRIVMCHKSLLQQKKFRNFKYFISYEYTSYNFHMSWDLILLHCYLYFYKYRDNKCIARKLLMLENIKEATDLQLVDLSEHLIILVSFYYICLYTNGNHVWCYYKLCPTVI